MMIHKSAWEASRQSGLLTLKYFAFSAICLGFAFFILSFYTSTNSIDEIAEATDLYWQCKAALIIILLCAMVQCGLWPFSKWLLSSLNAPTPVCALIMAMHLNLGGLLLVRFAHLYLQNQQLLQIIFVIGAISAFIATLWKFIQSDIKRMLVCATIAQMGFVLTQFGMGFISLAIAHIVWHSLFKTYLVLSSPSAAADKTYDLDYPPKLIVFVMSLACGLAGCFSFAYMIDIDFNTTDTRFILLVIAFVTGAQFSLALLRLHPIKNFVNAMLITSVFASLYGYSIQVVEVLIGAEYASYPKPLGMVYDMGAAIFVMSWLFMLFGGKFRRVKWLSDLYLRIYVTLLNSSQPHGQTTTANRNHYRFI